MGIETKRIKELMAAMRKGSVHRLRLKTAEFEIELEREGGRENVPPHATWTPPASSLPVEKEPSTPSGERKEGEDPVTSPMVGTYYDSPSPDDPPYIKVGDHVTTDSIVCIVEAMKVMNEVKASVEGTVTAILVKNGQPVEFGTELLTVRKNA